MRSAASVLQNCAESKKKRTAKCVNFKPSSAQIAPSCARLLQPLAQAAAVEASSLAATGCRDLGSRLRMQGHMMVDKQRSRSRNNRRLPLDLLLLPPPTLRSSVAQQYTLLLLVPLLFRRLLPPRRQLLRHLRQG